ncbi:MAG: Bax inhibitor-1/YccA family protein [Chitinophagaceae bacterium]|nr:Bax inhibitor-1/YccA family protein [Chitinophagaceae bacterium]MCW5904198.1 Bax inhibitor-1/YccA family protein [Chitinophagaceae bacterium]
MSMFKSGNPTLSEKIFQKSLNSKGELEGVMTVRGAINKFGFLLLTVIAGAAYTWQLYASGQQKLMTTLMIVGVIGGLVAAIAIAFKPKWAPFLAPAYGILEGLFIGALSVVINEAMRDSYPNIVIQAVGLTFGVAIAMFLLYNFRVIKATEKFKSIIFSATLGIVIFYGISLLLRFFGVEMEFMNFGNGSLLGIGISLFVVAIAALNLIIDFDMIEKGAEQGAPKFMEWYGAFALLVTIVWLYIEILKLLSRFAKRN